MHTKMLTVRHFICYLKVYYSAFDTQFWNVMVTW